MIKEYLVISCQGEQVERFINLCAFHNIKLWNIVVDEKKYYMNIHPEDFFCLKNIKKKTKVKVEIIKKSGVGFWLKKQAKRKIFLLTPFVGLFLLWIVSHFLWSVRIQGNVSVTDDLIETFLQQSGIHYGMALSDIPIYELKKNLRNQYDEITWVSMNLSGTCLEIYLKENRDEVEIKKEEEKVTHMKAPHDGVVESVLLRKGTLMVKNGQEVKKGDILIAGSITIPNEDGSAREVGCKAEGEVVLVYEYPVNEILQMEHNRKYYTGKEMEKLLFFGKKGKWGFDIRKIPFVKFDYVEESIEIPFLQFLSTQIKINKITYRDYVIKKEKYSVEEANKILSEKLDKIITSLEEKGVQIIEKNVKIKANSVSMSLTGSLKVKELCNDLKKPEENK